MEVTAPGSINPQAVIIWFLLMRFETFCELKNNNIFSFNNKVLTYFSDTCEFFYRIKKGYLEMII